LTFNTRFHYTKRTLEVRFIAGSTDDIFQRGFTCSAKDT